MINKQFLLQMSERQYFFIYSPQGYKFNKGPLYGKLLKDLHIEDKEGLEGYLEELFYHEQTSFHTKYVINDIMRNELKLDRIFKLKMI